MVLTSVLGPHAGSTYSLPILSQTHFSHPFTPQTTKETTLIRLYMLPNPIKIINTHIT